MIQLGYEVLHFVSPFQNISPTVLKLTVKMNELLQWKNLVQNLTRFFTPS